MLCGSLCYFVAFDQNTFLAAWCSGFVFIPVLSIVLSILMVCALPMFSMKMKRGVKDEAESLKNRKRLAFAVNVAIIIAIVAALGLNWSLAVLLSFVVYILMNVAFAVFKI